MRSSNARSSHGACVIAAARRARSDQDRQARHRGPGSRARPRPEAFWRLGGGAARAAALALVQRLVGIWGEPQRGLRSRARLVEKFERAALDRTEPVVLARLEI